MIPWLTKQLIKSDASTYPSWSLSNWSNISAIAVKSPVFNSDKYCVIINDFKRDERALLVKCPNIVFSKLSEMWETSDRADTVDTCFFYFSVCVYSFFCYKKNIITIIKTLVVTKKQQTKINTYTSTHTHWHILKRLNRFQTVSEGLGEKLFDGSNDGWDWNHGCFKHWRADGLDLLSGSNNVYCHMPR